MNRKAKIILLLSITLAAVLLVLLVSGINLQGSGKKSPNHVTIRDNWDQQYGMDNQNPYGLSVFHHLLRSYVKPGQKVGSIKNGEKLDSILGECRATYLFIGDEFGISDKQADTLFEAIYKGSTLVLSGEISNNILMHIFYSYEIGFDFTDRVQVHFNQQKVPMYQIYQDDTLADAFLFFYDYGKYNDYTYTPLTYVSGYPDLLKIQVGKGSVILQLNTLFLCNYQLKRREGFDYCAHFLKQLPANQPVYELAFGKMSSAGNNSEASQSGNSGQDNDSYLQFLLKSKAFLTALLLAIAGFILFLIFRSRRLQPEVPFIAPDNNTSIAFADAVTSLYYNSRNPLNIIRLQRKNFYQTISKHFFIDLSRSKDNREREIQTLSEKTEIPVSEINELLNLLEHKDAGSLNNKDLAQIARKKRDFYILSGIISDRTKERARKKEITVYRNIWVTAAVIILGFISFFTGLYQLASSNGIGVAFWPLAFILLLIGFSRLVTPIIRVNKKTITLYSTSLKKATFPTEKLISIEENKQKTVLKFSGTNVFSIPNWELNKIEKTHLQNIKKVIH